MRTFPHHRRRAIITIEVLGVLPIMLLFAVSVAEYSMSLRLHQRVAFASRYGAKIASEATRFGPDSLGSLNVAGKQSLKARIDQWLASSGLSRSLAVQLDHNACGVPNPQQVLTENNIPLDSPHVANELPTADPLNHVCYVRVTVWLPLGNNLPNALRTFGLDWNGAVIAHSTTFRLEADNAPPVPSIELLADHLPSGYRLASDAAGTGGAEDQRVIRLITDRSGPVDLEFSAGKSRDAETPAGQLQYRWKTSATAVGSPRPNRYRVRMNVQAKQETQRIQMALDVSDQCSCSSKLEVPVEVTRGDSLKAFSSP